MSPSHTRSSGSMEKRRQSSAIIDCGGVRPCQRLDPRHGTSNMRRFKWSRIYGGWDTGYYFYNNSSGIKVTNRPYDFVVKKRRTGRKRVRKRNGRPMTPEEEDAENNTKPQPLIELEAAWSIQRYCPKIHI